MKIAALLLAVLAAVTSLRSTDAHNTICLNANTQIEKVYIDGVNYLDRLPNRYDVFHCDCFTVPPNAGVIAVKAFCKNFQTNKPGISICETDEHAIYSDWVCAPSTLAKKTNWYKPDYRAGNRRIWKPASPSGCQYPCRHQKVLNCRTSACAWSQARTTSVKCIRKKCADGCMGCSSAGPGKCDPGMCKYGEQMDAKNNVMACKRTCRLEVKAFATTGTGYIKLTDVVTSSVSTYQADANGAYLATIDMNSCSLTRMNYQPWISEAAHQTKLQELQAAATGLINLLAVELAVGPGSGSATSYAPYIAIYKLGQGPGVYAGGINNHYVSATATLTGVNYGEVTFADVVTVA